jgi:hypothetical protein
MMQGLAQIGGELPGPVRDGLDRFCHQLRDALGDQLLAIILYGGLAKGEYSPATSDVNVMVVVRDVTVELLDQAVAPVQQGIRDINLAMMLLCEEDLRCSTDVFPTKFLDIQQHHRVIWGADVLDGLEISRDHLRLRCEQEIKNLLLRLRQFYLHGAHRSEHIERILVNGISSFLMDLGMLLLLKTGRSPVEKEAIAETAAREFDLDGAALQAILTLKWGGSTPDLAELKRLYGALMAAVQRAAQIVDQLEEA